MSSETKDATDASADPGVSVLRLNFNILGPLEVVRDGVSLDLGPPKQRAVLGALLLARGRVVSIGQLADWVWPDRPPAQATAGLQVYLSKLRTLLHGAEPGVRLVRRTPGYALFVDHLDLAEFDALIAQASEAAENAHWEIAEQCTSAALNLWRGSLLDDVLDGRYEAESKRLEDQRSRCLELQVTALLARSEVGAALAQIQDLTLAYPLREQTRWLHMVSLYRAGRAAEALASYQQYQRQLDDELGMLPGQLLRDLQTSVLRQDDFLESWPRESSRRAADRTPPEVASHSQPSTPEAADSATNTGAIVGRERELTAVHTFLDGAGLGPARWLLLSGPAGIGKTRLAQEGTRYARNQGVRIAWTNCPDDEGVPAWWPLRSVLSVLGADPDTVLRPPSGVDADTVRFRIYEQLTAALNGATLDSTALVVVDDVQWMDSASLKFLANAARSGQLDGVTFVLTMRDGEPRAELDHLLESVTRAADTLHLAVAPLDARSATSLLNQVAGETLPASEAFALTARTGGNPLLLSEYARLPRAERNSGAVPVAAHALLGRRLRRLPDAVLTTLRAAAVIGDVFELDLLAEVVQLDLLQMVDHLDLAEHEAVITPFYRGLGYQFGHALLRDEVLSQLSAVRRQALHAQIADRLDQRPHDSRSVLRRAQHLLAAQDLVDASVVAAACVAAAREAQERWDWDISAQQWAGALAAIERGANVVGFDRDDLLVAQLAALARAGRGQTVLDTVASALADAQRRGRTSTIGRLAAALLRTSGAWPWPSEGSNPAGVLARLSDLATTLTDDPAAEVRVLAALAVGNCYSPDLTVPESLSRRALERADASGDPDLLADAIVGRVLTFAGVASHSAETITLLDRLAALPHQQSEIDEVLRHNLLTMALFTTGDVAGVERHLRDGIAASVKLQLPVTRVQLRWAEVTLAQWQGDLDRAETLIATAFDLHQQTELYSATSSHVRARLVLLSDRGLVASDPEAIERSTVPRFWRAVAAAETGDLQAGRSSLRSWLADQEAEYWFTLGGMTGAAHVAVDLGDVESAAHVLTRLARHTDCLATVGQTGSVGPVALATGRLRAFLGDDAGARRDLATAERLAAANGGITSLIKVRVEQARLDPPSRGRSAKLERLAVEADLAGLGGLAKAARTVARSE